MKTIIIITSMLILSASSFCQKTSSSPTREELLTKSKTQKTIGFVLLGAGITSLAIASPGNIDFNTLGVLIVIGGAATLSSIPLFIASKRNKNKAALFMKEQTLNLPPSIQTKKLLAIGLKVNL